MENINPKDPKYLGIPNIQFSLTKKEDAREHEFSRQRMARGFDDSETWSLANTIASFIIPRLKRFIALNGDAPECQERYLKILTAMELIDRDKGTWIFEEDEQEQVDEGLELLSKEFMGLWW